MVKKIILVLLLVVMCSFTISCEGCSDDNPTSPEQTTE